MVTGRFIRIYIYMEKSCVLACSHDQLKRLVFFVLTNVCSVLESLRYYLHNNSSINIKLYIYYYYYTY